MTDIDPLEALYNAPAAGEATSGRRSYPDKPNLVFTMQIEGEIYQGLYKMPVGFPYGYKNERAIVESTASALAGVVEKTFVDHWFGEGGAAQ